MDPIQASLQQQHSTHTLAIFYVKYRNYLYRQVAESPKYPQAFFEEICRILCTVCSMYDTKILGLGAGRNQEWCGRVEAGAEAGALLVQYSERC